MPASLRSDGVRVRPGMPFGFPPEYAFSFAGIPIYPKLIVGGAIRNRLSLNTSICVPRFPLDMSLGLSLHGNILSVPNSNREIFEGSGPRA
jgi:hypothetical protein